ncbi:hypothetical protein ACJMK2_043975 [Sinanodonta woodiana]|uniref:CCHC-type domain-containing protein n=1 Tax=Sinanodonta woodiana TaxID=1069815 RepID=A0ABD3VYK8_SINWO
MSLWDNAKLTQKLAEGGNKINTVYQIGNKTHKISVIESDTPLKPLIQIGTTGTRYWLEQYKNKPRFCSNCKHWGHYSSKCRNQAHCNYCGEKQGRVQKTKTKMRTMSRTTLAQIPHMPGNN